MMYGALWDIEDQLNELGYTLCKSKELGDKLHFGLNVCHIHGILSDSEYDKGLKRLNAWIGKKAMSLDQFKEQTELEVKQGKHEKGKSCTTN